MYLLHLLNITKTYYIILYYIIYIILYYLYIYIYIFYILLNIAKIFHFYILLTYVYRSHL